MLKKDTVTLKRDYKNVVMRFKLTLNIDRKYGDCLPLNYQYEQSAVIYKILGKADIEYSSWLHDNGFQLESGKRFKLFCFSRFIFEKFRLMPKTEYLNIIGNKIEWLISFLPEKSTQEFIQGIFANQHFIIGNKDYKVAFDVVNVELLPFPDFKPEMEFSCLSPVCVRERKDNCTFYLSPIDEHYAMALQKGLLSRYQSLYGSPYQGDISSFHFELLDKKPKSALITIKAGTPQETRVRGYFFRFKLSAPECLLQIAYDGGIGEECSQGFGCIEKI